MNNTPEKNRWLKYDHLFFYTRKNILYVFAKREENAYEILSYLF